jgi:hypothetical protein
VTDTRFLGNTNNQQGAAMWMLGQTVLERVRFEHNTSGEGAALFHYQHMGSVTEGTSCDFLDNTPDDASSTQADQTLTLGKDASFQCSSSGCSAT